MRPGISVQPRGGTWKYLGTVPAGADADVPHAALLQRVFRAFVWSDLSAHTNLRWFNFFLFTVWGFFLGVDTLLLHLPLVSKVSSHFDVLSFGIAGFLWVV